jgi:hypothetical protein
MYDFKFMKEESRLHDFSNYSYEDPNKYVSDRRSKAYV